VVEPHQPHTYHLFLSRADDITHIPTIAHVRQDDGHPQTDHDGHNVRVSQSIVTALAERTGQTEDKKPGDLGHKSVCPSLGTGTAHVF